MKKFWKSAWGIALGTALFSFMLTLLSDCLAEKPVFSTIVSIITTVIDKIVFVLNFNLKLWWVLLVLVVLFVLRICYANIRANADTPKAKPSFMDYTEDVIDGWHIKWFWEKDYSGLYGISSIYPICNHCKTPLIRQSFEPLSCPRCKRRYHKTFPDDHQFKVMIHDNIDKGLLPEIESKQWN